MFAPLGFDNEKFKTELCVKFQELGACPYNTRCRFAHGEAELRPKPKPKQYKTKPCNNFIRVCLITFPLLLSLLALIYSHSKQFNHTTLTHKQTTTHLILNRQVNVPMVYVVTFYMENQVHL